MSDTSLEGQTAQMRKILSDLLSEVLQDELSQAELETIERITEKIKTLEQMVESVVVTASSLSGSVGQGGKNAPKDVMTVQSLLNEKGTSPSLTVDGMIGGKTVKAIADFQTQALGFADGRVDVGGQTWAALSGGSIASSPASVSEASGGGMHGHVSHTPPFEVTTPAKKSVDEEHAGVSGVKGVAFFSEKSVSVGPFTVKTQYDKNGKLKGVEAEEVFGGGKVSLGVGIASLSAGIQLLNIQTVLLNDKGAENPVNFKVSLKGFGSLTVGRGVGVSYELALEGYAEPRTLVVNTKAPEASTSDVPNPLQLFLKASGDAKVVAGGDKAETGSSIIKVEYDKILVATVSDGPSISLERGPGWHDFNNDVLQTIEFAKRNPDAAGTGPTVGWNPTDGPVAAKPAREELDADAMRHIADDAQKIMVEARERQLAQSRAALADPNVVGGANSLNSQNPSQAASLYGALWQQRTDAIAAAGTYAAFLDGGEQSPEAKASEAEGLANRCGEVLALFRNADAQWGYGKSKVWTDEGDDRPDDGSTENLDPSAKDEGEETIVDEVLSFFGFDGDEKK